MKRKASWEDERVIKRPVFCRQKMNSVVDVLGHLMPRDIAIIVGSMIWKGKTEWVESDDDLLLAVAMLDGRKSTDAACVKVSHLVHARAHHLAHRDWFSMPDGAELKCDLCVKAFLKTKGSCTVQSPEVANALLRGYKQMRWNGADVRNVIKATDVGLLCEFSRSVWVDHQHLSFEGASEQFVHVFAPAVTNIETRFSSSPELRRWARQLPLLAGILLQHKNSAAYRHICKNQELIPLLGLEGLLKSQLVTHDITPEMSDFFASDRKKCTLDASYMIIPEIAQLVLQNGLDKASPNEIQHIKRMAALGRLSTADTRLCAIQLVLMSRNVPSTIWRRCGLEFCKALPAQTCDMLGLANIKALAQSGVALSQMFHSKIIARCVVKKLESLPRSVVVEMLTSDATRAILLAVPLRLSPFQVRRFRINATNQLKSLDLEQYTPLIMTLSPKQDLLRAAVKQKAHVLASWLDRSSASQQERAYVACYERCVKQPAFRQEHLHKLDKRDQRIIARHVLWCQPLEQVLLVLEHLGLEHLGLEQAVDDVAIALQNPDERVRALAMNATFNPEEVLRRVALQEDLQLFERSVAAMHRHGHAVPLAKCKTIGRLLVQ